MSHFPKNRRVLGRSFGNFRLTADGNASSLVHGITLCLGVTDQRHASVVWFGNSLKGFISLGSAGRSSMKLSARVSSRKESESIVVCGSSFARTAFLFCALSYNFWSLTKRLFSGKMSL